MAEDNNKAVVLVNPGGRVVSVTQEHAEALLNSDEGFKKAPKGAKPGQYVKDGEVVDEGPARNSGIATTEGAPQDESEAPETETDENPSDSMPVDTSGSAVDEDVNQDPTQPDDLDPTVEASQGDVTNKDKGSVKKFFGRNKKK